MSVSQIDKSLYNEAFFKNIFQCYWFDFQFNIYVIETAVLTIPVA